MLQLLEKEMCKVEGLNTPLTETDAAKADESKNDKVDDAKAEQK